MLRTINFKSPAKEKERRKRKSVEAERRRRKKSYGCILSFYNGHVDNKKLFDGRGQFGGNVFKIQLDIKNTDKKVKFEQSHARILSTEELKLT